MQKLLGKCCNEEDVKKNLQRGFHGEQHVYKVQEMLLVHGKYNFEVWLLGNWFYTYGVKFSESLK